MEVNDRNSKWGGIWTEKKLTAFTKYVMAYLTIMKNFPFWKTIYFDGFAGSGERHLENPDLAGQLALLPEEERVYKGAAERVLNIEDMSFDYYYFIDRNEESLNKLKVRLESIPASYEKQILFRHGDCNLYLQELTKALSKTNPSFAALIFLDPFGMQINWESIAGLKGTRSDIWILIPTGVIVNRLLDKKGVLKNLNKLESFFGMTESGIRDYFYKNETAPSLFGDTEIITKILNPIEKISYLYIERLKNIWDNVTAKPLRLDNSKGIPLYHFVFASNNKNAVKIASQIIDKG